MNIKQRYFLIILAIAFLTLITMACESQNDEQATEEDSDENQTTTDENGLKNENQSKEENPLVTITMENNEKIVIELYPDVAPNTVNNFISLVEDGFYDGLIFHRAIPNFMIQGGDPDGNGTGGPGYGIKGEFSSNNFKNDLKHARGVISMARSESPDSAGSQFFIMQSDSPHLDEDYAGFGEVIEGMDLVDNIVAVEADDNDKPIEDQVMKKVEVDTKGHEYDEPEIIED